MKKNVFAVAGMLVALSLGFSSIARAEDFKKFGVRARAIYVAPAEKFDSQLDPLKLTVTDVVIPEVDLEYFFTKNISTELIAGVTWHDIKSGSTKIGSTWLLPPTLTVKYHPLAGSMVSPYVGVGLNATIPFKSKLDNTSDFKIDTSFGWAAQAGADIEIKENIYFNLDYKYINADTKLKAGGTKYNLDLNPHLFGVGIGYRF